MKKQSKYRGVTWYEKLNKWVVVIRHNNKKYHLGYFVDELIAAEEYDKKVKELKGDKAILNFNKYIHYCEVSFCDNLAESKYKDEKWLCRKHIQQLKRKGNISRTREDKNEIVLCNNYAEIVLYNIKNIEINRAVIDFDDVEKVNKYKWYLKQNGYVASSNYNGEPAYLHNVILGVKTNKNNLYCDHIDRDKLNCKKENLRLTDPTANGYNKGVGNRNKSGKKGVYWVKGKNKWCAMIGYKGKRKNLGYFDNLDEAIKRRIEAEETYFGEFRPINEQN